MKNTTTIEHHIPARVWDFFAYITGGGQRDFEEQRKRSVLAFFLIVGIIVAVPFAIKNIIVGNLARAIILLCVSAVQLSSLIALRYLNRSEFIFRLNAVLVGIYFIFLVFVGGANGSGILWVFIFPLFAFFLLGSKEGSILSLSHAVLITVLFAIPHDVIGNFPYQGEIKFRFLISYGLIILMSYFVEITRQRYQDDVEQARLDLEYKVERRTEELQHANKQLRDEISERELAVQRHQAAEQEKEIILSSLMEFVLFEDKNMQILWANRAACESAGMSQDELRGRYCYEVWAHGEDVCEDCPVQNAIQTGEPHELERATPDGREWFIRGYPVRDADNEIVGGIEVALEITDRKTAERELKEAYEIINKSPAVAFLWKNETNWPVEFVTANIEPLLGYTPDDLLSGRVSYVDIVHPDDLERVAQEVQRFSDEEGNRFNHIPYRIIAKDGKVKWVRDSTFIRRDQNGIITHYQGIVEDITDSRETELALQRSEERFRELADNIREVFWLFDREKQKVLYVSPAYEEVWGRSTLDLYERYEEWGKSIHPDDAQYAEASFNNILETGGGEDREYRIIRPDGAVRWILDRGFAISGKDGEVKRIAGIAEDITERKQAEEQLRATESNYRALFEAEPDGILIVDLESGIIVDANPSVSKLYGYSHDELCGMQAFKLSAEPEKSKKHIAAIAAEAKGNPPAPIAYRRHRKKDGTTFQVEILHGQYKLENQAFFCAIMRDITERVQVSEELEKHRKHLEDLVQERTRELSMAQEEILKNERLAVLGQLTATVSHELRNPLGVIRTSAFYLQQKNQSQDTKIAKHMHRIEDQVEICDAIVSDLLEYTRGRHSQMVIGEVNPWLQQVLDELPTASDIKMNVVLASNLHRVQFDKEKMRRVMVNLIDNAFQATAERKRLRSDNNYEPIIDIISTATDTAIMLQVKDNGVGMEPETMNRAFEPLFTTRARGTGLGLANVKKIIEEHDGTVSLQSKPNEGTTVIITIPAVIQD